MKKTKDSRKSGQQKDLKPAVSIKRFAVTYVLLMGAFFILIGLKPVQDVIDINGLYTNGVVIVTAKLLGIMNIPCTYQGTVINLPSIALDVRFGCNGLEAVMIYSVAVLAFPSQWKMKIAGIAAGFLVLQVINIIRIAGLAYSGVRFKSFFEYIHIYVAQGMMIAVSLAIFFLYIHYTEKRKATSGA